MLDYTSVLSWWNWWLEVYTLNSVPPALEINPLNPIEIWCIVMAFCYGCCNSSTVSGSCWVVNLRPNLVRNVSEQRSSSRNSFALSQAVFSWEKSFCWYNSYRIEHFYPKWGRSEQKVQLSGKNFYLIQLLLSCQSSSELSCRSNYYEYYWGPY